MNAPDVKRAHPGELARFNPSTKRCTQRCSPVLNDPRSPVELRFLCELCEVVPVERTKRINLADLDAVKAESERQQRVYAIAALKRIESGLEIDPQAFADLALKHILGPDWKSNQPERIK